MRSFPHRLPILAVLTFTTLSAAAPAAADPIQLVSGAISYSRLNLAQLSGNALTGEHVKIAFGSLVTDSWNPDHACFSCTPGSTISLSQSESFTNDGDPNAADGSVRVSGIDFWLESMNFQIDAGSLILPNSSTAITLSSPFAFRGVIVGRSTAGVTQTFNFFGGGTATSMFFDNQWFSTTYRFEAPPAVPEPGTLLLLAGPSALALWRKRRSQRSAVV